MIEEPQYLIEKLQMLPHPEGGYFKEMYKCEEGILSHHLPERYGSERKFSTAIFFLLMGEQFSSLHRIKSDEIWHFYSGSSLTIFVIDEEGKLVEVKFGIDFKNGEIPQAIIKKNCWFGAKVNQPDSYCLAGCTVAPGFHFDDFEMGDRKKLLELYPQHKFIIKLLTN